MKFKVAEAKPLPGYRLWLKFTDGVTGEVDLSDMAGHGVFAEWNTPGNFEKVQVGKMGDVNWGPELDLCPDALYMEVTGKTVEEVFPEFAESARRARA
jgi:hypothetical protein